jgi:hypothetical protein
MKKLVKGNMMVFLHKQLVSSLQCEEVIWQHI